MKVPIADGFYRSSSLPLDSQRCVNAYPVIKQTPHFERQSLFGTPGLNSLSTSLTGLCRGGKEMNDVAYYVYGTTLYKVVRTVVNAADVFTPTSLGTIPGSGGVSMAENGTQLMIVVPNDSGYIYDRSTDTFSQITDPDFTANGIPQYVRFIDGYFVCNTNSKKFIISDLNDGLAWNALDFGTAESDPDNIVTPHVHRDRLYMIGTKTTQAFENIGGNDFPFQEIVGFLPPKGCYAPLSVVESNNTFMMVGGGENEAPAVWAFNGNDYDKISEEGIDYLLEQLAPAELSAIVGWSYSERGAHFVGFQLRDTTIVFDVTSGRWHERRSRVEDTYGYKAETAWRAVYPVRAYGRVLVGDRLEARLGEADLDVVDEYGDEILRYVVTQPIENIGNGQGFSLSRIEATTESGVGDSTVEDPVIRMALSRDGVTFGPTRSRKLGKVGERDKRQVWFSNGWFPRRAVLKFIQSDKVKFRLIEVDVEAAA